MDPKPLLAYHTWINLPQDVRIRLTELFHIPRTGQVLVTNGVLPDGTVGGIVQQDGHSATDLYAITVEKMQEILNNEDEKDFHVLWNGIIENLDQIVPSPEVEQPVETAPIFVEEPRTTDTFIPRDPEELLKQKEITKSENMPDTVMLDNDIKTPNTEEHAKTKKGRTAKAK